MAGKRNEGLQDNYIRAPRGVFSDSQSPQSRRGGSDDTEAFRGDRSVSDGITQKTPTDSGFSDESGFRHTNRK